MSAKPMKACLIIVIAASHIAAIAAPAPLPTVESLRKDGLGLVHHSYGTYKSPGSYLDIYTVPVKIFDSQLDWDGMTPMPKPIETLIQIASRVASKRRPSLVFESISIEPFDFSPKKRFAIVTFTDSKANDMDYVERQVLILLDGTIATAKRIDITEGKMHAIWERGLNNAEKK